ncbi:MAG: TIGR02757 family protein [Saprospiraceae bacterium]|nr:TIGR02757 family protein [Saprospiraceae bacterium]
MIKDLYQIVEVLEYYANKFNKPEFIESDPISIPHQFKIKQDIEIAGFLVSMIAWGSRKGIIRSGKKLLDLMDNSPYEFVINHNEAERRKFEHFVHRTFNSTDLLYFIEFFQNYYKTHQSLEEAFINTKTACSFEIIEDSLNNFYKLIFSSEDVPIRTRKHVSAPIKGSRCKRLVMFLRWMVRNDEAGVDFGIWKKISMSQLLIPLDVHVERSARILGLLKRKSLDWKAVLELGQNCRILRPHDPAYYDFALFGLSIENKLSNYEIFRNFDH